MVDHDSGVLLWAHPGPDQKTLEKFFDRLGAEPVALRSPWSAPTRSNESPTSSPNAAATPSCAWARSSRAEGYCRAGRSPPQIWNAARRNDQKAVAKDLKGARYALWNPHDLTARQGAKLASIAKTNHRLSSSMRPSLASGQISSIPPANRRCERASSRHCIARLWPFRSQSVASSQTRWWRSTQLVRSWLSDIAPIDAGNTARRTYRTDRSLPAKTVGSGYCSCSRQTARSIASVHDVGVWSASRISGQSVRSSTRRWRSR